MKFLLYLALIFSVCSLVKLHVLEDYSDKAHPGKCVYKNQVLSPGESKQVPGVCEMFNCKAAGFGNVQRCEEKKHSDPLCYYEDFKDPDAPFDTCCERWEACA